MRRRALFYSFRLRSGMVFGILAIALITLGVLARLDTREPDMAAISLVLVEKSVVIDAGHGGYDPGVVGKQGIKEKDINLAIAKKLAELLRASGANVTMTRESDIALGDNKRDDLTIRIDIAKEAEADIYISIHGNSFPRYPSSHGAQVFYWQDNEESKLLADTVQAELATVLANTERVALAHKSAYILKNLPMPTIIVEMGFLSNNDESALLQDSDYQWRAAWCVYSGIIKYFVLPDKE